MAERNSLFSLLYPTSEMGEESDFARWMRQNRYTENYPSRDNLRDTPPGGYSSHDQAYTERFNNFDAEPGEVLYSTSPTPPNPLTAPEGFRYETTERRVRQEDGTLKTEYDTYLVPESIEPGLLSQGAAAILSGVTGIQDPTATIHGSGPLSAGVRTGAFGRPGSWGSYAGVSLPGPISTGPLILDRPLENILQQAGRLAQGGASVALPGGGGSTPGVPPAPPAGTQDPGRTHGSGGKQLEREKPGMLTTGSVVGLSIPSPEPSNIVGSLFGEYFGNDPTSDLGTFNAAPAVIPTSNAELSQGQLINPFESSIDDSINDTGGELGGWSPSIDVTQGEFTLPKVNLPGPGQPVNRGDLLQETDEEFENPDEGGSQEDVDILDGGGSSGGGGGGAGGSADWEDFMAVPDYSYQMMNRAQITPVDYMAAIFGTKR